MRVLRTKRDIALGMQRRGAEASCDCLLRVKYYYLSVALPAFMAALKIETLLAEVAAPACLLIACAKKWASWV